MLRHHRRMAMHNGAKMAKREHLADSVRVYLDDPDVVRFVFIAIRNGGGISSVGFGEPERIAAAMDIVRRDIAAASGDQTEDLAREIVFWRTK